MISSRAFQWRLVAISALASIVTVALIAGYLRLLLQLPQAQWIGLFQIAAVVFALLFAVTFFSSHHLNSDLIAYLKAEEQGEASAELLGRGFARLSCMPIGMFTVGVFGWSLGGVLVSSGMAVRYESFRLFPCAVMTLAAATGGFVSSLLVYSMTKHGFRNLRNELARRIGDPAERRALVRRVPLSRKLVVSVTGLTFLVVTFAMLFSMACWNRALQVNTGKIQVAHLEEWASDLSGGDEEALASAADRARRLGFASHLVLLDAQRGEVIWGPDDLLHPDELRAVLDSAERGDSSGFDSPNVLAWLRLGRGGPVVVAVQPWVEVIGGFRYFVFQFAVALLLLVALAFFVSRQLSADTDRATGKLAEAVEGVVSGKLHQIDVFDCEDEVGDLASGFERMATALRSSVGRVAEAADQLEGTGEQASRISESLSQGARDRGEGMERAAASMEQVSVQITGLADSAQDLNLLVEESSSSILEMGAASEELNDTATVLSSKVSDVFGSIEQMMRSVDEVGSNADDLSSVAGETSSSMEEMARSMRQVDDTACETARLWQSAVVAAESGRDKVHQTIESIESIRQATFSAERVIQGLGSRAKAIGSILDVIDDVADETNLLALNAAIIAAQAGEQGRAFSVVADEIKQLADRVLSNTKEIGDLIRAVQSESENAIGAIAEGSRSVARGVELSTEAGLSLEEITRTSHEAEGRIQEIVLAVQEQTKASDHVVEMMARVQTGVESIRRASAEQGRGNEVIHRSSVAMRDVSQQVRSTTEEQAKGSTRISHSVDGVRRAVEAINEALQLQTSACREVQSLLEEVSGRSRSDDQYAGRMLLEAARSLLAQAEDLRRDVGQFEL